MRVSFPRRRAHETFVYGEGPAVRVRGLAKSFNGTTALREATFDAERGSMVALLGPSGGGKTTTLRLMAGFETPDAGSVTIDGRTVVGPREFVPPERRRVGMVFQDYALFPHLTVRKNVAFGVPRGPGRERAVQQALELVGMTAEAERMPDQLSGGQQQRVALARALAPKPSVVLLDEPFSNLDANLRRHVRAHIRQILRDAETTAVFVTHDQDEAFSIADKLCVMLDNRLEQAGSPSEVYLYPASLGVARFMGVANILPGECSGGYVRCELGVLPVGNPYPPKGLVIVCVRPETVRLHPESDPSVEATVTSVEFHGTSKAVNLRLRSGRPVRCVMGVHIPAEVGETVKVGVNSFVAAFPPPSAHGTSHAGDPA
ncbi:MAG: ABC transporter ATP-binding protein [Chloroflexota bacterium]|nr:ABC transporter ATP-binding protein [Chloroflexota bacterium]MDE2883851.1 ABC transporter ATP-binding protein [Chloroflexota bacterium]